MDAIYDLLCIATSLLIITVIGISIHFWKEHKKVKVINQKNLNKDAILVSLEDVKANCGDILIHSGSIVKVADPFIDDQEKVKVYKNLQKEMDRDFIWVPVKLLRFSQNYEQEGYNKGIRNISMLRL